MSFNCGKLENTKKHNKEYALFAIFPLLKCEYFLMTVNILLQYTRLYHNLFIYLYLEI